jgi:S1-C subfamily serine protease
MKHFVILALSLVVMTFADGFRNGTGFFVNSEYIVTAYHVIDDYEHTCYYDIHNDTCYQVHVVDYDMETDIVLLKLDEEPVEMPRVCRIAHSELPIGEKLTSYGYPEPFVDPKLTIIPLSIRVQYRYDGNYNYYRMTGTLQLGMSGGPNFTTDGRIGGMSKSISTMERNTSNLVKSTEVIRLLRENGVQEYPNTRNVKKCVISIVNSIEEFKSAHLQWGV